MTSHKKSKQQDNGGHVQRLKRGKAQTCFGLAEKIIDEMLHCKADPNEPAGEGYQVLYRGIHLGREEGGDRKIPAASLLATAIVSNQLYAKGKSPISGTGAIVDDNVFCCVDTFNPELVNSHKAKADLQRLKGAFEERPDPFSARPEVGRRAEGSYWIGPFLYDDAWPIKRLIEALQDFHDSEPVRPELRRFRKKEYYIDCDRTALRRLLQAEGLLEKTPTSL